MGTPASTHRQQVGGVEIGAADALDLAGLAQLLEPAGRLEPARHVIVPPVELHEVEPFHAQPLERTCR